MPINDVTISNGGSIDSGKSTTLSVLIYGDLDDGNGLARDKIAKHDHEKESGRTSDISTKSIRVKSEEEKKDEKEKGHIVTLNDLCGHEKYFGTTAKGMGHFPDYGMVTIAANKGILTMTKQHLALMVLKKMPFFIVITKIDIAPVKKFQNTISSIEKFLRNKAVNRKPEYVNKNPYMEELKFDEKKKKSASTNDDKNDLVIKMISFDEMKKREEKDMYKIKEISETLRTTSKVVPVICISNKTGHYVKFVRQLASNLKPRPQVIRGNAGPVYFIDATFKPPGQGLVISGIVKGGSISKGDTLYVGPYNKTFVPVVVRSIHYDADRKRDEMNLKERDILPENGRGTFAIRVDKKYNFDRPNIRTGMVALKKKEDCANICLEFKARINIFYHKSFISEGTYTPYFHIGYVSQAAKLKEIISVSNGSKEFTKEDIQKRGLRQGDEAEVLLRFTQRPEYLYPGAELLFREGTTRGSGEVIDIVKLFDDPDQNPAGLKFKSSKKNKKKIARQNKIAS